MRFILLFLGVLGGSLAVGQDPDPSLIQTEELAHDLRVPWDLELAPDGQTVWFTERDGSISTLNLHSGEVRLIHWEETTHETYENSGMHSIALHPDFERNGWVYVHHCVHMYDSQLLRYTYRDGQLTDPEELRRFKANTSHNGSRLLFDEEGALWMCIGDAYTRDQFPQDSTAVNGKVLRMDENGGAFPGNPIADSPTWTLGHRNPQGMCMGPDGIYISEHGPDTDDEFNKVERLGNYGWPLVLGPCDTPEEQHVCDSLNIREPLLSWNPTVATAGMTYTRHAHSPFPATFVITTLKEQSLLLVKKEGGGYQSQSVFTKEFGRLRDVIELPDGSLLVCTSNMEIVAGSAKKENDDKIIRIYQTPHHSPYTGQESWSPSAQVAIHTEPNGSVRVKHYLPGKLTLTVFDAAGKVALGPQALGPAVHLEQTDLPKGLYFVKVSRGAEEVLAFERVLLRRP